MQQPRLHEEYEILHTFGVNTPGCDNIRDQQVGHRVEPEHVGVSTSCSSPRLLDAHLLKFQYHPHVCLV